jgi:aspartyl-tRNA(Asn)/glutamyl-tRNA(Gln) amidotransferase subunit B
VLRAALPAEAKLCANWLCGDWLGALNAQGLEIAAAPVTPAALAGLLARIVDGALSGKMAKQAFEAMWASGESADQVIERLGLRQIQGDDALGGLVDAVLAQYPKQAADYQAGQDKMLQFLVGQVMKLSRGQANPAQLNALLKARLGR